MSKSLLSFTAVYVVVAASFLLLPSVVTQAELIHLGREDGVFENIGAVSFLVASAMFLLTFKMSYGQKHIFLGIATRGNVYFGMLALLMFICFGEEISWGQRIWSWETPTWIASQNAQGETNLHNLWPFQVTNPDGSKKSWVARMLNMGRLLALFGLLYCIIVPLAAKLSSRIRDLLAWARRTDSKSGNLWSVYRGVCGLPCVDPSTRSRSGARELLGRAERGELRPNVCAPVWLFPSGMAA
jgi:hypothetical protein